MAVRVKSELSETTVDGLRCREEEVALLLKDRSVYQMTILVPLGEPSISMRGAVTSLNREIRRRRLTWWTLVREAGKAVEG